MSDSIDKAVEKVLNENSGPKKIVSVLRTIEVLSRRLAEYYETVDFLSPEETEILLKDLRKADLLVRGAFHR